MITEGGWGAKKRAVSDEEENKKLKKVYQ